MLYSEALESSHWRAVNMHVWDVVYTFIFHFQVAAVMLALLQIVIRSFSSLLDSIILQSQELVGSFVDT